MLFSAKNEQGFTLIEAMIAMFILSIGIFAVGTMQTKSIQANTTSMARSEAHAVALSFMEVLQQLPFDAAVLEDVDNDGIDGLDTDLANADYGVISSDFADSGVFNETLATLFTVIDDTASILEDVRGGKYQVFWNIADQSWTGSSGKTKVIKMFVSWETPFGTNSSEITAVKYNNIAL